MNISESFQLPGIDLETWPSRSFETNTRGEGWKPRFSRVNFLPINHWLIPNQHLLRIFYHSKSEKRPLGCVWVSFLQFLWLWSTLPKEIFQSLPLQYVIVFWNLPWIFPSQNRAPLASQSLPVLVPPEDTPHYTYGCGVDFFCLPTFVLKVDLNPGTYRYPKERRTFMKIVQWGTGSKT